MRISVAPAANHNLLFAGNAIIGTPFWRRAAAETEETDMSDLAKTYLLRFSLD